MTLSNPTELNPRHANTALDERSERARAAIKNFRAMQHGLTSYARAITGNKKVTVQVKAGVPHTDGTTIYYQPPIALGDKTPHKRVLCDKRERETGVMLCPACAIREEVLVNIYHEIGHIAFDTFKKTTDQARREALEKAVEEWGGKYEEQIRRRMEAAPFHLRESYLGLARLISPFLPFLVNSLEDARVDSATFRARKGVRTMMKASTFKIFTEPSESGKMWNEQPLNSQAAIACYLVGAGMTGWETWLAPEIAKAFEDEKLLGYLKLIAEAKSVADTYNLAFPILARLRELGFYKLPEDEPEPTPEPEPEPQEEENDDTGDESDDSEPEPESDDDGDEGESESPSDEGDESDQAGEDQAGDDGSDSSDQPEDQEADQGRNDPADGERDGAAEGDAGDVQPSGEDASGEGESLEGEEGSGGDSTDDPSESVEAEGSEGGEEHDAEADSQEQGGLNEPGETGSSDRDGVPGDSDGDDARPEDDSELDVESGPAEADDDAGSDAGDSEPGSDAGEADQADDGQGGGSDQDDSEGTGDGDPSGGSEEGEPADSSDADDDREAEGESAGPTGSDQDSSRADGADDSDGDDQGSEDGAEGDGDGGQGSGLSQGEAGSEPVDTSALSDDDASDDDGESVSDTDSGTPAEPVHDDADTGEERIDTGADEGLGGHKIEDYGTPEQMRDDLKAIHQMEYHEQTEPDSKADEEALEVAIMQGGYFETPSVNIIGVREHKWGKPLYSTNGVRADQAWAHDRTRGYMSAYSDVQTGIEVDLSIPESILGPALLQTRRVFTDNQTAAHQANLRSGRINRRVLGRRAWGDDDRLFSKKRLPGKRNYFVLIGIDVSGSTLGENIALAKRAAWAQAELCHRVGVDFAVYAHSASNKSGAWGREDLYLDIYEIKGPNEPWAPETKQRLETLGSDSENLDGHTMEYYRKVLDSVDATDKIILYYTDGKMPAANYEEELEVLQREIKTCKQRGYVLLGVGIRTDSPVRHGLDTVQVDTDADLKSVVMHLEKRLVKDR